MKSLKESILESTYMVNKNDNTLVKYDNQSCIQFGKSAKGTDAVKMCKDILKLVPQYYSNITPEELIQDAKDNFGYNDNEFNKLTWVLLGDCAQDDLWLAPLSEIEYID